MERKKERKKRAGKESVSGWTFLGLEEEEENDRSFGMWMEDIP